MKDPNQLIRNISDTAWMVAQYRADESSRKDAIFKDPYAQKLAGDRGLRIKKAVPEISRNAWALVARTYLIDEMILERVDEIDAVINLAAGLDTRPYRLDLPVQLNWIEVDYPEVLEYKKKILKKDQPHCLLEHIPLDLSNVKKREETFQNLDHRFSNALIISEGLLIYLEEDKVKELAKSISSYSSFTSWIIDLASPSLLKMISKSQARQKLSNAPFLFGPEAGPEFFTPLGWEVVKSNSIMEAAIKIKRASIFLRLISTLSNLLKKKEDIPWSGVCLFKNKKTVDSP